MEEKASSSSSKPTYPMGLNAVELPKPRARSTSRKGTKKEGNDPEGVPRRIRSKTTPLFESMPEKKRVGRPPLTEKEKKLELKQKQQCKENYMELNYICIN